MSIAITPRETIGLRPPNYTRQMVTHEGFFVHHGVSPNFPDDPHSVWRGYQNYHMNTHGWSDIGYSFGVTAEGELLEGRGWGIHGTHTIGYNNRAHAVCYVGNSSTAPVPNVALQAIVGLFEEHDRRYNRQGYRDYHGRVNSTSCPGTFLTDWVRDGCPISGQSPPPPTIDPDEEDDMRIIYAAKPGGGHTPNAVWAGEGTRERMEDPGLAALFGADWANSPLRVLVDYDWYMGLKAVASKNKWE